MTANKTVMPWTLKDLMKAYPLCTQVAVTTEREDIHKLCTKRRPPMIINRNKTRDLRLLAMRYASVTDGKSTKTHPIRLCCLWLTNTFSAASREPRGEW